MNCHFNVLFVFISLLGGGKCLYESVIRFVQMADSFSSEVNASLYE